MEHVDLPSLILDGLRNLFHHHGREMLHNFFKFCFNEGKAIAKEIGQAAVKILKHHETAWEKSVEVYQKKHSS